MRRGEIDLVSEASTADLREVGQAGTRWTLYETLVDHKYGYKVKVGVKRDTLDTVFINAAKTVYEGRNLKADCSVNLFTSLHQNGAVYRTRSAQVQARYDHPESGANATVNVGYGQTMQASLDMVVPVTPDKTAIVGLNAVVSKAGFTMAKLRYCYMPASERYSLGAFGTFSQTIKRVGLTFFHQVDEAVSVGTVLEQQVYGRGDDRSVVVGVVGQYRFSDQVVAKVRLNNNKDIGVACAVRLAKGVMLSALAKQNAHIQNRQPQFGFRLVVD